MVVPVLVVPFLVFTVACCVFKCNERRRYALLHRNEIFDAFVCYCYDTVDAQFAENTLRIELEENMQPFFKLCIHRRDFQAA